MNEESFVAQFSTWDIGQQRQFVTRMLFEYARNCGRKSTSSPPSVDLIADQEELDACWEDGRSENGKS